MWSGTSGAELLVNLARLWPVFVANGFVCLLPVFPTASGVEQCWEVAGPGLAASRNSGSAAISSLRTLCVRWDPLTKHQCLNNVLDWTEPVPLVKKRKKTEKLTSRPVCTGYFISQTCVVFIGCGVT